MSIELFTQYNIFTVCLIHTTFEISSSYIICHNETNKIKNILYKKHVSYFCFR